MSQHLYQASLRAMLQKSVWIGIRRVALDDTFIDTTIRLLLAQIDHLHGRIQDRDLEPEDLQCAVEASHQGQLRDDLLVYTEGIRKATAAAESTVRELLARELLDQTATKILGARNLGKLDVETPAALVAKAQEVSDGGAATPVLTLEQFDMPSVRSERGEVISLGLSEKLDRLLGGGIGEFEMVTYLGRSNIGKTSAMVATGASMVRSGYNVFHVIIGDSAAPKIARLYERAAVRVRKRDWTDQNSTEARRVLAANGGRLWIKDMSAVEVTADSLESSIRALKRAEGVPVHCVIVDYLELMSPGSGRGRDSGQTRFLYSKLCKQVRGLGKKLDTRILTAWQVNREGAKKDTATEDDLSELWDIFKHTDVLIVLNRSETEKRNKRMRLVVRKKREDDDESYQQSVNTFCEWSTMTIEDILEDKNAVHTQGTQTGTEHIGAEHTPGVARRPGLPTEPVGVLVPEEKGA